MFLDLSLKRETVYFNVRTYVYIICKARHPPLFIACEVNNLRLVE